LELTDVSKTALVTLRSHALESQKSKPLINDPMAKYCLDKLISLATENEKDILFDKKLPETLTSHIAMRARKYDSIIDDFISKNSPCTVINLGCGFDTRYWRIDSSKCRYIELDLPEVIQVKKEILKQYLSYELISCSVLDPTWIDMVTSKENRKFILIAEGLFMYLPKQDVINLLKAVSQRFYQSKVIFEVVTEKYTSGMWKKIVEIKMKKALGFDAGSSYNFGVRDAQEIESYGNGIEVIDEWSYFEDKDIRPKFLRILGHFKIFSRTQWTIIASLNENK
jgi:methyltransferase (TIGR00027 family)